MRDDAVLRRALPLGRGLGRTQQTDKSTYVSLNAYTGRSWALNIVQNSRRQLDCLFTLCDPVTWTLTFDLILTGGEDS